MKISIIGSGNIATFFAHQFNQAGHEIVQVISRSLFHAKELAVSFNASFSSSMKDLDTNSDICLLAVKDDVILSLFNEANLSQMVCIHTAGSISIDQLLPYAKDIGSIWCLYSVNKNHLPDRKNIPLIINASNALTLEKVNVLASAISDAVYPMSDEQKRITHLAAVFANNFSNFLFTVSSDILAHEQIPFSLLIPLIQNTIEKLNYSAPENLQTGPAIRNDDETIQKHLHFLNQYPEYKEIYQLLSRSIRKKYDAIPNR